VVHPSIPIDTWEGHAWIGLTPFEVTGLHPRFGPPVARFPELNLRTYTTVDGKPGIYFFSLDAHSWPAVFAARRGYRVPYFRADMAIERDQQGVSFRSERVRGPAATFQARYAPAGAAVPADRAEPFETWLTERYCLYTVDAAGHPLRGEIHHPPWPLRRATAEIKRNTMGRHIGIELEGDPLLHYSHRQEVVFWPLARA
jgi:uncharacterized protein YqjF (DUF2071 family)